MWFLFVLLSVVFDAPFKLDGPFESTVLIEDCEAVLAKAASIEPQRDSVAVFLVDPEAKPRKGKTINVQSNAKFVTVRARKWAETNYIAVSKRQSGEYYFFGDPGKYAITIIEFDPEKGINFSDMEATIGPKQPDNPGDDPPPTDDTKVLFDIARAATLVVNDPPTAKALSQSYFASVEQIAGKAVDEAMAIVTSNRRAVLLARTGESRQKDWNAWLQKVEPEVAKFTKSLPSYISAIKTLSSALQTNAQSAFDLSEVIPLNPLTIDQLGLEPIRTTFAAAPSTGPPPRIITWDLATQYKNGAYNGTYEFSHIDYALDVFGRYWNIDFQRVTRGGQYHVVQSSKLHSSGNRDVAGWTSGSTTYISPVYNFQRSKPLSGMVACHEWLHVRGPNHHSQDGGIMGPNGGYLFLPSDYRYMSQFAWKGTLRPTDEPDYVKRYLSLNVVASSENDDSKLFPLLTACLSN